VNNPLPAASAPRVARHALLWRWFDRNILELGRQMRWSYLPPLMVYVAAGVSGLTGIVGTFFVKDYLGLSAAFLAALGFWAGLPWALKMPLGHLVDLIWRWKSYLVFLGAGLIAASLFIMIGLIGDRAAMAAMMKVEAWFVLATLLAPVGYVIQDVVADAMTVEAVPRVEDDGTPVSEHDRKAMHTTMQTLGRVAIIGGTVIVALANVYLFRGASAMPEAEKVATYLRVYTLALIIPLISVCGIVLARWMLRAQVRRMRAHGVSETDALRLLHPPFARPQVNWWILGGGFGFAAFSLLIGLGDFPASEEIVFVASMAIVIFMIVKLVRELEPEARNVLVGTALVIFVFRAMPATGDGSTWWMIDELGFDQQFISVLSLIASGLTLFGMFIFRRFMAENSIAYVVGWLTVVGTFLSLPTLGMYYGVHEWTAAHTNGVVDADFIALVDTALSSPLGQIAMIPMLAWIANSAPENLKATFFAVMASFTNLALAASQLFTKYLNEIWVVQRAVTDPATGVVQTPADYSQLGELLIAVIAIGFVVPLVTIGVVKLTRFRSA
jgi:MFS family permease